MAENGSIPCCPLLHISGSRSNAAHHVGLIMSCGYGRMSGDGVSVTITATTPSPCQSCSCVMADTPSAVLQHIDVALYAAPARCVMEEKVVSLRAAMVQ